MKKLFSIMLSAVAGMLLATSCTNENEDVLSSNEKAQVVFALNVDGFLASRAATEGMNADKLVYALFDAEENLVGEMKTVENAFASGATENVSLSLAKGQTYTITFWAQKSVCEAYELVAEDGGLKVNVDYNGSNNDETRDAFYASETFTVEDNADIEVVLKRPFAQINLGVSSADWQAAIEAGLNITSSKVVIKNAATSINLLDGSVSGETVVDYDFAAIPSVESRAAATPKTLIVNDEEYKWLSMSFILTDQNKSTLDSDGLQFTLATDNGGNIVLQDGLHNVPVQSNWRTNVVGDVLTGNVNFQVTVDPIYYSTATVSTVDEFKSALADSNIKVIYMTAGEYDMVCLHNKGSKVIESVDPANPATIMGVFGAAAPVTFNYVKFDVSDNSLKSTGHKNLDRFARKSIVPVYAVKAVFNNCEFVNLYDQREVVAINYQAHKPGVMLEIDNCSFQGYAYTIYSRALIKVTNSTFKQFHSATDPRTIFLYGLGDGTNGKVIFKNNVSETQPSYTMELSSANYNYKNIAFEISDNTNFGINGEYLLMHPDRDFTGCTLNGEPLSVN